MINRKWLLLLNCRMGAALGRVFGEAMFVMFPNGIRFSGEQWPIVPGYLNF